MPTKHESQGDIDFDTFRLEILADYRLACESREASLLGRKEVLTGKAKLLYYRRAAEPEIFYTLMKIRNRL